MIVMKFGGTSVADAQAITRVINLVKTRRTKKTIIVVSAISEATNILTRIATLAAKNRLQQCKKILLPFKNRHLKIAKNLLHNKNLHQQTQNAINSYFTELDELLTSISSISELSDHSFAKTVSYGELLSSVILHATMLEHNLKNILIDARKIIITDNNYQKGTPIIEKMAKIMPPLLNKYLTQGDIVLTQGFIASSVDGATSILGREGSDYSASLIGMIMDADEVQIWTDVDGIMTCDPRKITNTKFIPQLSFCEAAELSYFGAKVIHPLTIQPAAQKNIPVRILNSMNSSPKQKGTLISNDITTKKTKIISITYKEEIKIVNIIPKHKAGNNDFFQKTFTSFANQQITIDAATISGMHLTVALSNHEKLDKVISELSSFAIISIEDHKSLIAIVGKNLNGTEKTARNILQVLYGLDIRMLFHGASNTTLLLVAQKSDLLTIVQKLHNTFFGK